MQKEFSVDLARRESHAIGVSFPEADSTVTHPGARPSEAIQRPREMPARANWGRWAVDCATSWCTNAWMPDLDQDEWLCSVCGVPTAIVWPVDPIAIEAVLLMRPDPNTRNWQPGETVADLVTENAAHGILPEGAPGPERWHDPEASVDLIVELEGRVIGGLVYGPVEEWRAVRGTSPSITADGEPRAYQALAKEE